MNNSSKLIVIPSGVNFMQISDEQYKLGIALYEFLRQFNIFEITSKTELPDHKGGKMIKSSEDLCIGNIHFMESDVFVDRDFFNTYPSLICDWKSDYATESLELLSQNKARINRTDGTILIEGSLDKEMLNHRHSIQKTPNWLIEYTINDFISVDLSRKVNGEFYYVLDMFRLKKHNTSLVKYICIKFQINKLCDITKTLYFRFTEPEKGTESPREIGIWDIVNSCPVNGFKKVE